MWDAAQYLKYTDERSRPYFDLLARVQMETATSIVDLGCGPGNLTRTLVDRWPAAQVIGVDSSPEMLEQAKSRMIPGRLEFVEGDITTWTPSRPIDLIVSNAALQWVSDHDALIARLVKLLTPAGTLAVQIPYHFETPAHRLMEQTKLDSRWRIALQGVGLDQKRALPAGWYVERLLDLGCSVDAWQTTYIHVLTGANPVLEWFKGSALRPMLSQLDPKQQSEFLAELGASFRVAYPAHGDVTLLPFPRLFFVATRR